MTLETATVELGEKQLVIFDLAEETYGVDIGSVREIICIQEITKVPRTPEFVEGVINLRGKVIPVIALRKRFGFHQAEATKDTRIVVVDIGGTDIGELSSMQSPRCSDSPATRSNRLQASPPPPIRSSRGSISEGAKRSRPGTE